MTRQKYIIRCKHCGHRWQTTATKPPTKCQNLDCGQAIANIGMDLSSNRAPAQIGQNNYVKAADLTAEMTMRDYGLTDLQGGSTGLRAGDTMAPKLPPALQEKADNFFGSPKKGNGPSFDHAAAISSAMAGAVGSGPPPIADLHRRRYAPPVRAIASTPQIRTVAGI